MSAAATSRQDGDAAPKADLSAWLAVAAGTIGSFMATLDISIVNAALPTIQGEIGASGSEGTWISTAYLVSEIIMIPLTGWLVRVMGLRTFLLVASSAFTVFSVMCGLSSSLPMMIVGRVGQGFTGGALIPTALTIIATRLPGHQQKQGTALFGMTVIMGPVLGPITGGWLAENISWHYAFFMNLPICFGLICLLLLGLPHDKGRLGELLEGDWLGILGLAAGLGGLTVVLEEGQREQWFESDLIRWLSLLSAVGFALLIAGQFLHKNPVIQLKILLQRSFGANFLLMLVNGMLMFGMPYIVPQFLAGIAGYNSEQAGYVLVLVGIPCALLMPFTPKLLETFDVRWLVLIGMLFFAAACFSNLAMTADTVGKDFVARQLLQGIGLGFALMSLNQSAISSVPPHLAGDASGLFNAGRNLGGSIALAMIATIQERRQVFHSQIIGSSVSANSPAAQDYLNALSMQARTWPGAGDGQHQALAILGQQVQLQAAVMTFEDLFILFGVIVVLSLPLILLLKPLPKDSLNMAVH